MCASLAFTHIAAGREQALERLQGWRNGAFVRARRCAFAQMPEHLVALVGVEALEAGSALQPLDGEVDFFRVRIEQGAAARAILVSDQVDARDQVGCVFPRAFGGQVGEYWATPAEALIRGQGDCEDYAIAKFFTLTRMGVAANKLRLSYVKALGRNQAHMVLAYYATPDSEPLLLDNLKPQIKPASQRKDLLPVYAFNNEGIYLSTSPQKKSKQSPQLLSRWNDVRERAVADGSATLQNISSESI